MATAPWRVKARPIEGIKVDRKGREKVVAVRRVERMAILVMWGLGE